MNGTVHAATGKYWAFLSYSHADRRVAERLHRAIESYRIPRSLVGQKGPLGTVPRALHPVFRDRDELTASGQIGAVVEAALGDSRALIVLCSPASALSPWVAAELDAFHRLLPDAPVLCVLLEGEPLDTHGAARECLPRPLRARFATGVGMADAAPVAVDLRPQGDGWRLGVQKLVAGMAGIPLDQLVQRDAHRRHRRLAWLTAALAAIAIAMGAMTLFAVRARDEAQSRRAQAEGLIEFMLGDLRGKLEPVGRLDALDVVGARALRYYDSQDPRTLDADALGRRSRALHMIGDLRDRRGDRNSALQAFQRASETTAELLQRNPDDPQRIYDQAQSVFWVAYASDWQTGKSADAEAAFVEYQKLARKLVGIDPANLAWQGELAYSHSNLGTLLLEQGRTREALTQFEMSRRVNAQRLARAPSDIATVLDLGQDESWLSSAYLLDLQIAKAIALRRQEIALYTPIARRDPRNALVQGRMLLARRFLAEALIDSGDVAGASSQLAAASRMVQAQRSLDLENTDWVQADAKILLMQAQILGWQGRPRAGLAELQRARPLFTALIARDGSAWAWKVELQESLAQVETDLLRRLSRRNDARRTIAASVQRLQTVMEDAQQRGKSLHWLTLSEGRLARLLDESDQHAAARKHWQAIATRLSGLSQPPDAEIMLWLARAKSALDESGDAQQLRQRLLQAGYRHPDFEALTPTGELTARTGR